MAGGAFIWTPEFVLPTQGWFECDFTYMVPNRPNLEDQTGDEEFAILVSWF